MGNSGQKSRLTDAVCRRLATPAAGKKIYPDGDTPGFGIRITTAGARSFVIRFRRRSDGAETTYTIGSFPDWSAPAAREEARRIRRLVDQGADPAAEARAERSAPSVADLIDRFEKEYLPRKRPRTQVDYRSMLHLIQAEIGKQKVAAVEFGDIDALHRTITKNNGPYRANRLVAVTGKMFSLAVQWRWRTDNPCKGVERNDEQPRKRYLSPAEIERLFAALAEYPGQDAADVFRLLLLSGCRRGEALGARWSDFDLDRGVWTKLGTTTKQRRDHVVPLSAAALEILRRRSLARTDSNEFVFVGRRRGGCRVDVRDDWIQICKAAKIDGVRIHDLRHSYASLLVNAGVGLHVIGNLLGHSQAATTARYSHLYDDTLRTATDKVGALVSKGVVL